MAPLPALALLALLALAHAASLRVREAGFGGRVGRTLVDGDSFCPDRFSSRGFNVECVVGAAVASVRFNVNGNFVRREGARPFMIAGDSGGNVFRWNAYPRGRAVITCIPNTGPRTQVTVRFECPSGGQQQQQPRSMPVEQPPRPPPRAGVTVTQDCIVIRGAAHVGPRTRGWEKIGNDAVVFEKNNNFEGVYNSDRARLRYEFTPVKSGVYGFSLDMGIKHWTEHNDVFVQMDQGFDLRRFGNKKSGGSGFLKAYHNNYRQNPERGRAVEAYNTDFMPHSFSTAKPLQAGRKYTIVIGARSTKVTIYNLVLFPCSGLGCDFTRNNGWANGVNKCRKYLN